MCRPIWLSSWNIADPMGAGQHPRLRSAQPVAQRRPGRPQGVVLPLASGSQLAYVPLILLDLLYLQVATAGFVTHTSAVYPAHHPVAPRPLLVRRALLRRRGGTGIGRCCRGSQPTLPSPSPVDWPCSRRSCRCRRDRSDGVTAARSGPILCSRRSSPMFVTSNLCARGGSLPDPPTGGLDLHDPCPPFRPDNSGSRISFGLGYGP